MMMKVQPAQIDYTTMTAMMTSMMQMVLMLVMMMIPIQLLPKILESLRF